MTILVMIWRRVIENSRDSSQVSAGARVILAHGAGAGMDSEFMQTVAADLKQQGFDCILFNFPYMEKRAQDGKRRPPDRAPKLLEHFRAVIKEVGADKPLIIGGKSMGGRIASIIAAESSFPLSGLLLLGYPFHPPGKPEKLAERTKHLKHINIPTLLVQGERDTFGGRALLETLSLPESFETRWMPDGDHSFKPRKKSGHTLEGNMAAMLEAIADKRWG